MNEIRIGLIGGGWMGKAHTTAFHNAKMIFGDDMPVFEIVSDVTEDAAKAFAEQMGYARYTADWHDVVSIWWTLRRRTVCTMRWQRQHWSMASMCSARSR